MAHTKGQWKFMNEAKYDGHSNTFVAFITNKNMIFQRIHGNTKEEAESNAKLFAAAPELLECLIEAVESMELETSNVSQKWIDTIKKATA